VIPTAARDPNLSRGAFRSDPCPGIGWQQYLIDGQNAMPAGHRAQIPAVVPHARPRPLLGSLHKPRPHRVQVKVFYLLGVFLNRPHRPVEKSRLPEKAPLSSAGVDAMRRAHLDGFHAPRDGERITREDDRMIRPTAHQEPQSLKRRDSARFRLAARRKRPCARFEFRSSSIAPFRPSNIDTGQAERSQDRIGESS